MTSGRLREALEAHRRGDLIAAEEGYRAALAETPDDPDALALWGVALDGLGRKEEALAAVRRAIARDPTAALFRLHLGNMLAAAGDGPGAVEAFREAAVLEPRSADIFYNLGNALRQEGKTDEAKEAYLESIRLAPDHALARNNLAIVYEKRKDYAKATILLEEVVRIAPHYLDGWLNLSGMAEKNGDYVRALEAAEKARLIAPGHAKPWFGIGVALNRMGRNEEALKAYLESVRLDPLQEDVWDNIGQTYQLLNRLDEAEKAFRECIARAGQTIPDEDSRRVDESEYGGRHWHLALLELLKGDYKRGFARYRARFKDVEGLAREAWPRPLWQGEGLAGKKILVMDEQGMGDCLMMARYLPLLKERGAHVKFYIAAALAPLFEGWRGADEIIPKGQKIPDFDFYASIFDLPYVFGTTLESVPAQVPYLPVLPPDKETALPSDGRPKIGVVWAGTPLHKHDLKRSLPLVFFKALFEEKGVRFYSFNRDKREGDDEILSACDVIDLAPRLRHFGDSARLMGQMDLIISCDTATAHLAGGLGKPVWTLLPFAPDWRWLLDREDSPWYPTMRLFRQKTPGDWTEVIERLRSALSQGLSRASW